MIESLLLEALKLQQDAALQMQQAEALNALGSLKQKQKAYSAARESYQQSLQLRRHIDARELAASKESERLAVTGQLAPDAAPEASRAPSDAEAKSDGEKLREQAVAQVRDIRYIGYTQ